MARASTIVLKTSDARCEIVLGQPLARLPQALTRRGFGNIKVMVVADAAVAPRYGKPLLEGLRRAHLAAELVEVASGETSKTLEQAERLYRILSRGRFERTSLLIALGGGVVGDLAGFVAATYLRGMPLVQVPTTLLAQVDASIGGKTAVDIPEGKNLVGAFYQPCLVWIDPSLLKTLPPAQWRNGLAEVIKYGAIRDKELLALLERQMPQLQKGYSPAWLPVIARCAAIKAEVVAKDPKETTGLRAILNFGHSIGHAIEAASGYRQLLHGEAVSIGMFVAGRLSEAMAGLKEKDRIRLETLLTQAGLPSHVEEPIPRRRLLEFLSRDKKTQEGSVRFVLLKGIGKAVPGRTVAAGDLEAALSASNL
jgi:3-dehydroquinate synthase